MDFGNLRCVLCLLSSFILASNKLISGSQEELISSDDYSLVSLNESQKAAGNLRTTTDIERVKKFLKENFDKKMNIVFELSKDLPSDLKYYKKFLKRKNLNIKISFDKENKNLVTPNLKLSQEYINNFLEELKTASSLTTLDISGLDLTEIPNNVYSFKELKVLNLSNNKLENSLLKDDRLPNLQTLDISNNKLITAIDKSICKLKSLKQLKAQNCNITDLSQFDCNLKSLDLSGNPIKSILNEVSKLKKLESLNLKGCKLGNLTIDLVQLPKLDNLDLSDNTSLEYFKLLAPECTRKIKSLNILNCPLINVYGTPNAKNLKFEKFDHDHTIDYGFTAIGDNFYLDELNNFADFSRISNLQKSPNFNHLVAPTPLTKAFPFEIVENKSGKDQLINKWTKICSKLGLASGDQFEHSKRYLKNLYGETIDKYYSDWKYFMYPAYKEKMRTVLATLFAKMNKNEEPTKLQSRVENILRVLKKSQSEQLVYCNFLLNSMNSKSFDINLLDKFTRGSIDILKDYVLTLLLNIDEHKKLLNGCITTKSHGKFVINQTNPKDGKSQNNYYYGLITILSIFKDKFTNNFVTDAMFDIIDGEFVKEISAESESGSELNGCKTLEDISNVKKINAQKMLRDAIGRKVKVEFQRKFD